MRSSYRSLSVLPRRDWRDYLTLAAIIVGAGLAIAVVVMLAAFTVGAALGRVL